MGGRSQEDKVKAARSQRTGVHGGTGDPVPERWGHRALRPLASTPLEAKEGWRLWEAWRSSPRWVSQACLCSNSGSSSPRRLPASPLLGGRCQGTDYHYDEVSLAQTQGCQLPCKGMPAVQRDASGAAGRVSKGPRAATSAPRPALYPEPMPARPGSWAPAQPPAPRRTAGKRQGPE